MTSSDLRPLDRGQLLRDVELQALRDSQADWSGRPDDPPPAPANREIDRWVEQRLAQVDAARVGAEQVARDAARAADAELATAQDRQAAADDAAAVAHREEIGAVLRGERGSTDGGNWADESRMSERPGRRKAVDLAIYVTAAVAEIGLNFLAFQLMGAGRVETALLAAAVVLVTVLLPKQIGVLLTTARRTGRWAGWPLVLMGAATTLWVGVSVFTSLVRTAYLLLPGGGRPALLAVAGIGPVPLTLGWLAVALAVGVTVLLRSSRRHNPYASAWHRAVAASDRAERERAERRRAVDRAAERAATAQDALRGTSARFAPAAAECRSLAEELKARYAHALGRRLGSAERTTFGPATPAIGPADGSLS